MEIPITIGDALQVYDEFKSTHSTRDIVREILKLGGTEEIIWQGFVNEARGKLSRLLERRRKEQKRPSDCRDRIREEDVFIVVRDTIKTTSHAKENKKTKSFFSCTVRAQRSRTEKVFTQVKIAAVNNGISPIELCLVLAKRLTYRNNKKLYNILDSFLRKMNKDSDSSSSQGSIMILFANKTHAFKNG